MRKLKLKNNKLLKEFDRSLIRDKSNDIIKGNFYLNDKEKYRKLFIDLFYDKIKEFFIKYLDKMNNDNKSLFIEINNKKIKVNKMF